MASDIVDRLRDRADHMELYSPEQMELSDAVAEVLHLRAEVERLQTSVDMLRAEAQEWRDKVLPTREENTRLRVRAERLATRLEAVRQMAHTARIALASVCVTPETPDDSAWPSVTNPADRAELGDALDTLVAIDAALSEGGGGGTHGE